MSPRPPEPGSGSAPLPWSDPRRPAELAARKPTRFDLMPDAPTRAAIAQWAGISALDALRLKGELVPQGRADWLLRAEFEARVVQPCAVTDAPVATDLREPVTRRYIAGLEMPSEDETEMPEDDTIEPLPAEIDLAAVALEALELALPLCPRAPGAEFGTLRVTAPGTAPLQDEDIRPFAGLRDLLEGAKDKENKG